MPIVPFDQLPDSARLWIFASDREVSGAQADTLLAAVDDFLSGWRAHGVPLQAAREWRENRFLAIGVDVTAENASGCSIDGLFRILQALQREIGAQLVGGGRVFYRSRGGAVETTTRDDFSARAKRGEITMATPVFDTGLTDAAAWRTRFEAPAGVAWTAGYFKSAPTS
ncbi:MAG TPA: hypothetical protein VGM50_20085 [Gemmatimonadaceae bacterium]|jgi:hypothetical protein